KETIKRKRPSFNEAFYGYKTFGKLLEDAARRGLLELTRDAQNRSYIVTRFGPEMSTRPAESAERAERTERAPEPEAAKAESAKPAAKKASRSPRSSRRRSRSSSPAAT